MSYLLKDQHDQTYGTWPTRGEAAGEADRLDLAVFTIELTAGEANFGNDDEGEPTYTLDVEFTDLPAVVYPNLFYAGVVATLRSIGCHLSPDQITQLFETGEVKYANVTAVLYHGEEPREVSAEDINEATRPY